MKIEQTTENTWNFWCPGCNDTHMVSDSWEVNAETATISPSVLVHSHKTFINADLERPALFAPDNITTTPQCHSFVTNGQIQFLGDSTHALAGQTVELPDLPRASFCRFCSHCHPAHPCDPNCHICWPASKPDPTDAG